MICILNRLHTMTTLKNRIDINLLVFLGFIIGWIILAGGVRTPASEIADLQNNPDPEKWIEALTSDDRTVRNYAKSHILEVCSEETLGPIALQIAEYDDPAKQFAALWVLARADVPGRGILAARILEDENSPLLEPALAVLAEDPVLEARGILIALTEEMDFGIRAVALEALAAIANPDDLPIFLDYIGDPITEVREAAIEGVYILAPDSPDLTAELMSIVWGSEMPASREALRLLGDLGGPESLDALFVFLDSAISVLAAEAATAIGKIGGEEAIERALEMFRTARTRSRAQAARALGELNARVARDDLIAVVLDENKDIWLRYYSMEALATCGDESLIPDLLDLMNNPDTDQRLVRTGIEALGGIGGDRVLEIYDSIISGELDFGLDQMGGQTSLVSCVMGLGKMDSDSSRERLRSILENSESDNLDIIIGVIRALGNVGTSEDIPLILGTLTDKPVLSSPVGEAIESIEFRSN